MTNARTRCGRPHTGRFGGSVLAATLVASGCGCAARADAIDAGETDLRPRLVSKTILGDELLWDLGPDVRARTVGVSQLADDPRYSPTPNRWPASLPRVGSNPAEVLSLRPDLVIVASFTDEAYRTAVARTVPVLELRGFTGLGAYVDNLDRVAEAVGEVERARELRAAFEARIDALSSDPPWSGPNTPSCLSWGHGSVAAAETTFDAAADAAGCINVPAVLGLVGHRRVDAEQLVAWDPDFVVLSCREASGSSCETAQRDFSGRAGFGDLRAVRAGQVITIPPPFLSTTGVGMADLAERIHAGIRAAACDVRGVVGTPTDLAAPDVGEDPPLQCGR